MKKRKSGIALLMLSLGAVSLIGCGDGDGPEIHDNQKIKTTCKSCNKEVEVNEGATICPDCGKNLDGTNGSTTEERCKHTWGEWEEKVAPTETNVGKKVAKCTKCGKEKEDDIPALGFLYNVVFKNADGSELKSEQVRSVNKIEKPADPTAPAGQVFYGWKNVKNGGQIWDFDNDVLGLPHADVELVPCFVPANVNPQYIEAELAPAITANGGMDGATYSGGAKGKGMIQEDSNYECGSGCEIEAFDYYVDPYSFKEVVTTDGVIPDGTEKETKDPKGDKKGYFFHFNYIKGNELVFNIVSDAAVDNVTIFGRFGAEYGVNDTTTGDRTSSFNENSFPITVNGTKLTYGTITMRNIPIVGKFLPFQDYMLSATVSLKAGNNVISMKVDNTDSVNGTLQATSPCIDCLKVYTTANLSWPEAELTNIIK
ncbi:MAG: hypothetical protein K6E21_01365 [Bacilli bacterium]|nr:hypothetical protein [Bacilli bacterium]